jgi:phosphatidylserine/phosphatidylglycerophosphate/cardiolipin synthase-like enzyme
MPLDFSAAPDLDLIYLSSLHLRADFAGYLMVRMLRHHAARGTIVRIIVADALMGARDRALIEALAADFPNVQLQYFRWHPPGPGSLAEGVAALHRVHHVKALVTVGSRPGTSRAITGGRNLHDGFVFDRPVDLSALPFLHNYDAAEGLRLDFFASYDDFEAELRGDAAVRAIAAHLSAFWHRDPGGAASRPPATAVAGSVPEAPLLRHFISVPAADGHAQEALFIELIDAARDRIVWVTPYLNGTPAIEAALLRARARGVRVTIHLRMTVNDPVGQIITALNRDTVNRFAGVFEVFDQAPSDRMRHTKLLLIDGRLAMVMSTNLNRRSFIHDSENGLMVLDPVLTARLERMTDRFRESGPRLRSDQPVPPLLRLLFGSQMIRDML